MAQWVTLGNTKLSMLVSLMSSFRMMHAAAKYFTRDRLKESCETVRQIVAPAIQSSVSSISVFCSTAPTGSGHCIRSASQQVPSSVSYARVAQTASARTVTLAHTIFLTSHHVGKIQP